MKKKNVWRKDDSYTHIVRIMYSLSVQRFLSIWPRKPYDEKGYLPANRILLKLSDDEYEKLTSYSNPAYEEYNREFRLNLKRRSRKILYGFINRALGRAS